MDGAKKSIGGGYEYHVTEDNTVSDSEDAECLVVAVPVSSHV